MSKDNKKVDVSFTTRSGKVFRFLSKKPEKSRLESKRLYFMGDEE